MTLDDLATLHAKLTRTNPDDNDLRLQASFSEQRFLGQHADAKGCGQLKAEFCAAIAANLSDNNEAVADAQIAVTRAVRALARAEEALGEVVAEALGVDDLMDEDTEAIYERLNSYAEDEA
jgi:hypothetical protein